MTDGPFVELTDGIVVLRASTPADVPVLVAGRDAESRRWLGRGSNDPRPTACILVAGEVVGWVDHEDELEWLGPGEVNVGYQVFPRQRGHGYASRAVQLLMHHLAMRTARGAARLSIDRRNQRSLAIAHRLGFAPVPGHDDASLDFRRPVPPRSSTDGALTLRRPRLDDLAADLDAKDDEQIRWMWLPGQRESWERMSAAERQHHAARGLHARVEAFGRGPKWTFSVDSPDARYVAYVDCDLANEHVPPGEANVAYSVHPQFRRRGHAGRAVGLVRRFLREHTGARELHLVIDAENRASLAVASAVGAQPIQSWVDDGGRTMVRHVAPVG